MYITNEVTKFDSRKCCMVSFSFHETIGAVQYPSR